MLKLTEDFNLDSELSGQQQAWSELLAKHQLPIFRATTLSLKVADKAALYKILTDNQDNIGQVHIGTVSDRYIASAILNEPVFDMPILKILERRPGSEDPLGLDSVDYLVHDLVQTYEHFVAADLPIVKENNEMHEWLSLRFGPDNRFEAKLTDHIVLAVAIKELQASIEQLV
jgi:hypothetical protein